MLRHVHALKQQEKRRKRNTTIAAASETSNNVSSPTLIRTASVRKSNSSSVGGKKNEIFLKPCHYRLTRQTFFDVFFCYLHLIKEVENFNAFLKFCNALSKQFQLII